MINETIILVGRFTDCSGHRLAKHFGNRLIPQPSDDTNYLKPLQGIFSRVVPYDYMKRIIEIGIKGINEELLALVEGESPKYVFRLPAGYLFQESTISAIRGKGSIVVGLFFDDEFKFDSYSKWWAPYTNYCITHDIEAVPKYKALGTRVIQEMPCTGVSINVDWANVEEKYAVSFVGSNSRRGRKQYISALLESKLPVHFFVSEWGQYVSFQEMLDIFRTSRINLNFSGVNSNNRMGFKGRLIEVCLAGGFLLTEYVPGIENYFEIDKEIACFHNADEMIDKIICYLGRNEERRAIAQAGWERATSEYTPFHMFSRVFTEIERDITTRSVEGDYPGLEMPPSHIPLRIRRRFSLCYLSWLRAFSLEGYKGFCQDTFRLAISYYPFNIWVWCYYLTSLLPYPMFLSIYELGCYGYHMVKRFLRRGK